MRLLENHLKAVNTNWERHATTDPLWSILTHDENKNSMWNIHKFFETGKDEITEVISYAKKQSLPLNFGSALDFGCGVGRLTQALADYFKEVYGVDVSPAMVNKASEYNKHNDRVSFHLNLKSDLSLFENDTFDFIYSNITLQHMNKRLAKVYIIEMYRTLKPGGLLVFQEPTEIKSKFKILVSIVYGIILAWRRLVFLLIKAPYIEMHYISQNEMKELFKKLGVITLHVRNSDAAGQWFNGLQYFITKPHLSE